MIRAIAVLAAIGIAVALGLAVRADNNRQRADAWFCGKQAGYRQAFAALPSGIAPEPIPESAQCKAVNPEILK